jgi:hypothetical protein
VVALYSGRWRIGAMSAWAKNHRTNVLRPLRADLAVVAHAPHTCDREMRAIRDRATFADDVSRVFNDTSYRMRLSRLRLDADPPANFTNVFKGMQPRDLSVGKWL